MNCLDMTIAVDWDIKPQTKQANKQNLHGILKKAVKTGVGFVRPNKKIPVYRVTQP